jgi:tRNA-2-methylthio-N6-dimethylallyladenosine synthase
MSDDIINAVRDLPKVCEYFHLPLQSGDDRILKAMNRGYTADQYRKLVENIRNKIPGAAITSDIIAGFPGETDEAFKCSCDLIRELELDYVNTYTYSARHGTAAAKLAGHLPESVKEERLHILMQTVEDAAAKRNAKLAGTTQEILVERWTKGKLSGRTRGNKLVKFKGDQKNIGMNVKVRITDPGPFVLEGEQLS